MELGHLYSELEETILNCPGSNVTVYGQSELGKDLYSIDIGDASKERIVITGGLHAGDEPAGVGGALDFAYKVSGDSEYASLLDDFSFSIYPCANPDGYELSSRENAKGIDVNRVFHPDSEAVEAQHLMESLHSIDYCAHFDLHEGYYMDLSEGFFIFSQDSGCENEIAQAAINATKNTFPTEQFMFAQFRLSELNVTINNYSDQDVVSVEIDDTTFSEFIVYTRKRNSREIILQRPDTIEVKEGQSKEFVLVGDKVIIHDHSNGNNLVPNHIPLDVQEKYITELYGAKVDDASEFSKVRVYNLQKSSPVDINVVSDSQYILSVNENSIEINTEEKTVSINKDNVTDQETTDLDNYALTFPKTMSAPVVDSTNGVIVSDGSSADTIRKFSHKKGALALTFETPRREHSLEERINCHVSAIKGALDALI